MYVAANNNSLAGAYLNCGVAVNVAVHNTISLQIFMSANASIFQVFGVNTAVRANDSLIVAQSAFYHNQIAASFNRAGFYHTVHGDTAHGANS